MVEMLQDLRRFVQRCQLPGNSNNSFIRDVYPSVRALVPHEMFACAIVHVDSGRVVKCFGHSFPPELLGEEFSNADGSCCPAFQTWIKVLRPLLLDTSTGFVSDPQDRSWLKRASGYGLRNLVVHGAISHTDETACYIMLGGVSAWCVNQELMLQMLMPHIYQTLANRGTLYREPLKSPLTPRESEVLKWVSIGKSNAEIASILGISPWTVKIHIGNLLKKLNASTRGHAIAKAIAMRLVPAPEHAPVAAH